MKKLTSTIVVIISLWCILTCFAFADTSGKSDLFTYSIKGNGTAVITDFDWSKNNSEDIFIPGMIDGYPVTTIGKEAFSHGTSSVGVHLPDSIKIIEEKAFMGSAINSINIPDSVQSIGPGAFADCQQLERFNVSSSNSNFAVIDNILYSKSNKQLLAYAYHTLRPSQSISIPKGIVSIAPYAFYNLNMVYAEDFNHYFRVASISLPDTLTVVDDYAFSSAGENTECCISFNAKTIEKIGQHAFSNSNISIGFDEASEIACIGEYAFYSAKINCWVHFPKIEKLGEHAFEKAEFKPSGSSVQQEKESDDLGSFHTFKEIKNIPAYAFSGIKVKGRLKIENDIISVGKSAFENAEIKRVYGYGKSFFIDWDTITSIENNAFLNTSVSYYDFSHVSSSTYQINLSHCQYIGDNAFSGIHSLAHYVDIRTKFIVTVSDDCKYIGNGAFSNIKDLSSVSIGKGVETIGKEAFIGTALTEIELPSSVKEIGDNAFDRLNITISAEEKSYAYLWAEENGYSIKKIGEENDLSWLN